VTNGPGGTSVVNGNFANSGTINMWDADTQDVATFNGNLVSTGGQINIDLALTGGGIGGPNLGDMIVVTGDFQGTTTFNFRNLAGSQSLQPDILVADLNNAMPNPGANPANLTATGLPAGLVTYSLVQNGAGDLVVRSSAIATISGIAANVAVVQSTLGAIVNRPSSPFVSGLAVEVEPGYCGPGVWMRGTGGAVNATGTATSNTGTAVSSTVGMKYAGAQFGMDLACFNVKESGIDVSIGAIAGYNGGSAAQALPFGLGVTQSTFNQGYGGLYATVAKGQFSADIQARADFTRFRFNNANIALNNTPLNTVRATLSGSASYAVIFGPEQDMFFVPTAGFSASRTTSSTIVFNANQSLTPNPSASLVAFTGATLAKTFIQPDQVSAVQPFVTATVYNDFAPFPTAVFTDTATNFSETVTSSHLGVIGEVSLGTNFFRIFEGDPKQLNATVRIDTRFSSILLGAGITAQVRAQF
jgi:hypothetical protein